MINKIMIVAVGFLFLTSCVESGSGSGDNKGKFSLWQQSSFFQGAVTLSQSDTDGRGLELDDLQALKALGANVVSFSFAGPFDPDPPYGLNEEALESLDNAIDLADEAGLYAIIHFRNGPGKSEESFASDNVFGREDEVLWFSEEAKAKWVEMWKMVAERYTARSHVVGYNLMVEPHPEDPVEQEALDPSVWYELARQMTVAIREVDEETPIIVSATKWSWAAAFRDLETISDSKTIYSFHNYEPYVFTHQGFDWAGVGNETYEYPGQIPGSDEIPYWNKAALEEYFRPVIDFQRGQGTPILVGEFGCNRSVPSCVTYLDDLLSIFEEQGWSYTFWAWRMDVGFDYEKGVSGEARTEDSKYLEVFRRHWGK